MPNNREIGASGEDLAVKYLEKIGYKILERNVHFSRSCELDIIALDRETLVAVEVKSRRSNSCGTPFEAITKQKFNNIKTGLFSYLQTHNKYKKYRIDAISVMLKTGEIEHLKNISL
ncbi:YraN family protein [bacterium]|nr:YraN family protein [bacterium]